MRHPQYINGLLIAHYANAQYTRDGILYTDPPIPDDHPDITGFKSRFEITLTDVQKAELSLVNSPVFRGLVKVLANRFRLTPSELIEAIKQQV